MSGGKGEANMGILNAALTCVALVVLYRLKEKVMSNQDTINALAAQLTKAAGEITAEVQALKDAVEAGETLDFSGLETVAQSLDDRTPDAPVEPETPVDPEAPASA